MTKETTTRQRMRQYSYRIPIRMTSAERAIIGRRAQEYDRSVSRYLVELALKEKYNREESHPNISIPVTTDIPTQVSDTARLHHLQERFQRAIASVRALLALPLLAERTEAIQRAKARLTETLLLLESLSTEIARRLTRNA